MTTEPTIDLRTVRAGSVVTFRCGGTATVQHVAGDLEDDPSSVLLVWEGHDFAHYTFDMNGLSHKSMQLDIIAIQPPPPTLEEHLADANRRLAENDGRFAEIAEIAGKQPRIASGTDAFGIILSLAEGRP